LQSSVFDELQRNSSLKLWKKNSSWFDEPLEERIPTYNNRRKQEDHGNGWGVVSCKVLILDGALEETT
jgi:hypothetical protein